MLDSGEKAEIQVWLMNRPTATAITSNSSVNYMASGGLTSSGILDARVRADGCGGCGCGYQRSMRVLWPGKADTLVELR